MKRVLLTSAVMLCALLSFSQLQEDFEPIPSGWILSQGAAFQNVGDNAAVITPGVGGNNPAVIGTPIVNKTSNTFEVTFNIKCYASNLNQQLTFPCATYADVLFVKSTVTSANDATLPENILARVDNHLLPMAGGNTTIMFTFPGGITEENFKVFLSFHSNCTQGGVKYVIDDMNISGVNLICGGTNCPPGVSNDLFNRPLNEMSFNAILYGSPIDISYPSPAGYTTDPTGTDGDQNDDHSHLKWTLVTPPTNGTVVVNADGTATVTRNAVTETTLTFTYMLCDDGPDNNIATPEDNMCSGTATVTVRWPSGIMPVALKTFNAARNKNYVNVTWETATETNNIGFEVQRDADKSGFRTVGFIFSKAAEGNSSSQLSYEFNDVNQSKGVSLYRLKQIDIDGQAKYSPIKAVKGDGSSYTVTIYPTPSVTGDVSVSVNGIQEFDMTVLDMNGRIIKEYKRPSTGYVKVTNLQSGIYVVKIVDLSTGEASSEKIVVNRR